jgi:bifunctional DNase/RNase
MVEMVVEGVETTLEGTGYVVTLREKGGHARFPIAVGFAEARAIKTALRGDPWPQPHDLILSLLQSFGAVLTQVEIRTLTGGVCHARLCIYWKGRWVDVSCRPSDGIALAVRSGCPLLVAEDVLAKAGWVLSCIGSSRPGPAADDPSLAIFRDFINSLNLEGPGESSG